MSLLPLLGFFGYFLANGVLFCINFVTSNFGHCMHDLGRDGEKERRREGGREGGWKGRSMVGKREGRIHEGREGREGGREGGEGGGGGREGGRDGKERIFS